MVQIVGGRITSVLRRKIIRITEPNHRGARVLLHGMILPTVSRKLNTYHQILFVRDEHWGLGEARTP